MPALVVRVELWCALLLLFRPAPRAYPSARVRPFPPRA